MKTPSLLIENSTQEIPIDDEKNLLQLLLKNEIDIDHSCGGMGSCGTCRVFVTNSATELAPRNDIEQERANDLNFAHHERLACQLVPFDALKIKIPYTK